MDIKVENGKLMITLDSTEIAGVNIDAGPEYSAARLYSKVNDNEYFSCGYEWNKNADIPDFVVALMSLIKQNKTTSSVKGAWSGKEAEYADCLKVISNKEVK